MNLFEDKIWLSTGVGLFFGVILLTFFISNNYTVNTEYSIAHRKHDGLKRNIMWIPCDPDLDDPTFSLCDDRHVVKHYQSQPWYKEQGVDISELIVNEFADCPKVANLDGFITIRFLVNCTGNVGRIRTYELDRSYQKTTFPQITSKVVEFLKQHSPWNPGVVKDQPYDTFCYLNCRVEDGIIKEVKI